MSPRPELEQALRHSALVRATALAVLRDTHLAEDVVQQTLLAASRGAGPGTRPRVWHAWLRATARKLALATGRGERRRRARQEEAARPEASPSASEVLERVALQRRVAAAVEALPSPDREIVALRYWDDAPPREIARRLGLSTNAVSTRLSRAKARLAEALEDDDPSSATPASAILALWRPHVIEVAPLVPLGLLAMKKLALAAAVILALLLGRAAVSSLGHSQRPMGAPLAEDTTQSLAPPEPAPPTGALERSPDGAGLGAERVAAAEHPSPAPPMAAVEPAHAPSGTILVRVTESESGAPARDVGLEVVPWSVSRTWFHRQAAVTDANGFARFERVPPGHSIVYVRRLTAGDVFGAEDVHVVGGETDELALRVVAGVTIHGTVRDDAGRTVAGAEVWLGTGSGPPKEGDVVTRTDGAGRYKLRHASSFQGVAARATGHAPSRAEVPLFLAGESSGEERTVYEVDLVLGGLGGTLEGTVVDRHGSPGAGALVVVSVPPGPQRNEAGRPIYGPPDLILRTDAMGRFRTEVMGSGALRVRARGADSAVVEAHVTVPVGGVGTVRLELGSSATVYGRVTSDGGVPIEGAIVGFDGDDRTLHLAHTTTAADGRFELPGLPPGSVTLEVSSAALDAQLRATLELMPGEVREWLPVLTTPVELVGRVVDEHGAGLAGWIVSRSAEGEHTGAAMANGRAETDSDGGFRLRGCLDVPHTLTVRPPGQVFSDPVATAHGVTPSATPTTFAVPAESIPVCELRGRCVDAAGAPVTAEIQIQATDPTFVLADMVTDSAGTFTFRHLVAAEYHLRIDVDGRTIDTPSGPVRLGPGAPSVDLGNLVVE
jgi:RNA polymerase sigma factor (sigma-70 family)